MYFSDDELRCKCGCGKLLFDPEFRATLEAIREDVGFPMIVTSGYRCPNHPDERAKARAFLGEHAQGCAVDVAVRGEQAYRLIKAAIDHNITRIGVHQKGEHRFIHLGGSKQKPHPTVWSY